MMGLGLWLLRQGVGQALEDWSGRKLVLCL